MDESAAFTRVERTFWTVWNYISGAVTRFLRSEPAANHPRNAEQERREDRQTIVFDRAESDPSQRDDEEEEEEKKGEEQSDLTTASLPQPPVALPAQSDTLLLDTRLSREVQCTAVSTRWSGIHSTPEEEETHREQWLIQTEGERTEQALIKDIAATQQKIEQEMYEKLLFSRHETRTEEPEEQAHQQDTDEENGHHHLGLGEEIEKTLAADGPEGKANQAIKEEEEARVRLTGDEEPNLNNPNDVSGFEAEGNDIVKEDNITFVNEDHWERTEEEAGEGEATSTHPENTDGVPTLSDDQTEKKSSEVDLTGIVSDEDGEEKADLVRTFSDFQTLFVESPEPSPSSLVSSEDNTVVGHKLLKGESKQRPDEVKVKEKEQSSLVIEGSDDFYRKGSDLRNQEVDGTEQEITKVEACGRATVYAEEMTPVKNQEDDQNDDSQLPEEVNQTREEEYGDLVLQTAQDKELNYSMNTEAETEFNSPEHRLCFVNPETYDTEDSLSASSGDYDDDDGEGGVSTHWSVAIDSPGVALMVKAESNNEQEMSAELQDVSPGTFPGSGAGTHGLNFVPCEETRGLIPEVNNGRVAAIAATAENTEQGALMGRASEGRWLTSQSPHASGQFKYVAGLGDVDHSQREDQDTTLKSEERENTAAGPDVVVGGSVDPESLVDSGALWGMEEQISGRAEQEREARRTGGGLSDDERSRHEAHKTDGEDFKSEEPLFEFTLDRERRSESTGASSDEAAASEDGALGSIWYDNIAAQDGFMLCEEILILPDAVIQNTTEACEGDATATTMTEENSGRILSLSEDYVEPESLYQPIENQIKSFEDGQMETEEIVVNISDVAMGKDVSNARSEEATAESVQQRNVEQFNGSRVETTGMGSLTDMRSDLLMEVRDLPDELLESTTDAVPELQTETSTEENMEHVSSVKAVEDESALAFGPATEEILPLCAETVFPEDKDHTPSDTTEMENQAVSLTDTRTPSSSSSSSRIVDDEAADKTSKKHEEEVRDPDEREETSGQIEGENEGRPPKSYSAKSGLVGISDLLEAPECDDSEHKPECEVLTTTPEGIILSEMLMTVPPGVLDVSPHSFTEERPTYSNAPEQEPQHHPLWSNEEVSSQVEQDESSYELQMNEEMTIKVDAFKMDPESSDGVAADGRDETSVIAIPISSNVDEDRSMEILILPDAVIQNTTEACEGDATATTMTEENSGRILSLSEDNVEPESLYQPIENQIKSFEDGQMETEEIVVNISDVAMGKDVSNARSEEATAESVQQRNVEQFNGSRVETTGMGSLTDMRSDLLMEVRDLPDELLESTTDAVPELQTETSTEENMEHVSSVKAVEDESALAFGPATEEILPLCAETVFPEDKDHTPSDTTEMENQAVSLTDTRTPSSSSSSSRIVDDEAADKTSKKHEEEVRDPDEREETSGQIEGENEERPPKSYSAKSGLVGISDLLEAPECDDSEHKPECEVLTTTPEGIILSEMLMTAPPGVLDVSPHSFTEERPTYSNAPEQEPQHHPLWSNEEVSSQVEQDESSYELQMNEEMTIKVDAFKMDPESSDGVAADGRDETSVIAVPISSNVDEDCSMEILILPDAVIQNTTEACEGDATATTMTEENSGRILSLSEDYVEPESLYQPIENQIKSFEDGQMETEEIVVNISDVAMGKDVSNARSEEATAESVQQRNVEQFNGSRVETTGMGSLTDMRSDLLMEVRDLPDELLESTTDAVPELQTETSTEENMEHVSSVKAVEDESALAFGPATEEILPLCAETVFPEDKDHTPSDTTEMENQAVSLTDTRTPSSSSSSSPIVDDEAADKTSKKHEEEVRDPDEREETSGQIEGENEERPPKSYSAKSGLVGISDLLEAPECDDSEHKPECEVLTTTPEGIILSEMLMTAPPGVLDVSPHSFTEERPTYSNAPEQEPQHHPLWSNEEVSSQVEQDESSYELQMNEEMTIKVDAFKMDPESSDGVAADGRDETSVIAIPVSSNVDEDCSMEILILPDAVIQNTTEACEGDATATTMTEENSGRILSLSEDYVEPESLYQPIENQIKSFEDGQMETEEIVVNISDVAMGKDVSNARSEEATAESVQQRNVEQFNGSRVETTGMGSLTDMRSDLLMEVRDLPDELLESTTDAVPELQTETSTEENMEHVSSVKAVEDESALAFGPATEEILPLCAETVFPEDKDHTPSDTTEMENQAVSLTDTRTPSSSSSSSPIVDDEAADKTSKKHEEEVRDPDEREETSGQIEGENEGRPPKSYSAKSGLVGISDLLEAPECDDSEHKPECEVLTTTPEGIILSEMLMTAPPGVLDVSPHSFTEERPTYSNAPEQEPQHHPLWSNEEVSSQVEQDESSYELQMNEEMTIKVDAFKMDPESSDGVAADGRDETSVIAIPVSSNVDEDCSMEILILPDAVIQNTTEACEGDATATTMTEENSGRILSLSEDYVEPESLYQPIENQIKSFEDGQMETEEIVVNISDVAMGKDVSNARSEEATAESVQQRNVEQFNGSRVETTGMGSLTDMRSDLLMEVRDLPDELLESTTDAVPELQTETSTEENMEHVSSVKAVEDESALAFGPATEEILPLCAETVFPEDKDHTPSDTTEMENQAVSLTDTRTPSSSSSSSPIVDDEAADKTSKKHEEEVRDPDEREETSGQIEGENEGRPPKSYSAKSGLVGISDLLEAPECDDSEHKPECEVLTTTPEGIILSEMLMTAPPGVLDVSPHSFTEERPTYSNAPEQEPQHHPLWSNEEVSSQVEQDESSYELQMNEEMTIKVDAFKMDPESSDGVAADGRDETSVIVIPVSSNVDEDCSMEILILPDAVIQNTTEACEGDATATTMTEENSRRILSLSEDYVEPESLYQPIENQIKSFEDGQMETEEIVVNISDVAMGKDVSNARSEEATAESVQQRNVEQFNGSRVETTGMGSLTDMRSDLLMEVRDLPDELLESTTDAVDGRDETSVIAVPISSNVDEDCSMAPGVDNPSHLLPSDMAFPAEVNSVVLRDRKGFGESRQGPCLDSKHPLYNVLLMKQARSRMSEFIDSPVAGLSTEERARQRHSLPPGSNQFELDINVLDLTVQKSRILVKNPSVRPPTDPRALLQMPSLEPSPSQPSSSPLAGRPLGGLGVGIKLPAFGVGFPALKKTRMVEKDADESVPEQKSEPQQGMTSMSPKPTVADRKPRWTPPKRPGFGNPLMSELKSKLKKTSEE